MSKKSNFEKVNIAVAFSVSILSLLILVPVVSTIHIPLEKNDAGIVSLASIENTSPYTNYIKFFILLLVPSLLGAIALNARQSLVSRYWRVITRITQKAFILFSSTRFYTILILSLILLWAINKNYSDLDWALTDGFHEGEYLGFLPNFLSLEKPFLRSFMIHGFGLDVLASLIASKLADHSNIIALTRFLRMTQGLIGYFGCYWIIWELIASLELNFTRRSIFFLSSILFTILDGIFFDYFTGIFAGRDTLFILQLALIIRFFRLASFNNLYKNEKSVIPIIIGTSIPISILYVYDRAAYFFFVYLFACGLSLCFGRRFFIDLLSRSIFGLAVSSILTTIVLGPSQISEILSQILFWVRYGRYISFSTDSFLSWVRLSSAALTQIFAILYLISDYKKSSNPSKFLKNRSLFLILLFAALVYMRIALDRPNDFGYIGSGSLVSVFLLIYLGLSIFKAYFQDQISQLIVGPPLKHLIVIFITLIIVSNPALNPFLPLATLRKLYITYKTPDTEIIKPEFLRISNVLKSEVNRSSCFFTLDQAGLWYYLFNKPSCSKFSITFYARTTNAQETVIHEIDMRRPNVILFGSIDYANVFDGIPISDAAPIIYRYFLNYYKPYVVVESQWFWKKSEEKLVFKGDKSRTCCGSIDTVLSETILQGDNVLLSGFAMLPSHTKVADAVYVSYGENNQLVEVTKVDRNSKWTVPIPSLSLPAGKGVFRVWSYDAEGSQLMQIGQDINVNLVAR